MKNFLILSLILILSGCYLTTFSSCDTRAQSDKVNEPAQLSNGNETQNNLMNLKITLRAEKNRIKLSETIRLETMLLNNGVASFYIYPNLQWGYSASLSLFVLDSHDQPVEPTFFDDSITKPVLDEKARPILLLAPYHFLGIMAERRLNELNIAKAGSYKLYVEYHSPLSTRTITQTPFWGKESGVLRSNSINIDVTE